MNREESFNLLKKHLKNENLIKHSIAVETGMRGLADYFDRDRDLWGVCGLLHDIDYEEVKDNLELHSKRGAEILKGSGYNEDLCEAVLTHNVAHNIEPKSLMGKALFCLDGLTGLIVAATLVLPSRKIKELEVENVLNRFEEKNFAKSVHRENIAKCEKYLNLSLEKFVSIVLSSMKEISDKLGL